MAPSISNFRQQTKVVNIVESSTITINCDSTDIAIITTLSQNTTFANPIGNPSNGQLIQIRVTSSTSRTISFDSNFQTASALNLPTSTTGNNKEDYISFQYNTIDSKWDLVKTTLNTNNIIADPLTIGSVYATSTIRNNNVETIVSTIKPATRLNTSSLIQGDIWYNPSTQIEGFYDGVDFVTRQLIAEIPRLVSTASSQNGNNTASIPFPDGTVIKVKSFYLSFANTTVTPTANFLSIFLTTRLNPNSSGTTDISTALDTNVSSGIRAATVNTSVTLGINSGQASAFGIRTLATGTNSNNVLLSSFTYVVVL